MIGLCGRFRLFHAVLPAHVEQENEALDRLLALTAHVGDEAALAKEVSFAGARGFLCCISKLARLPEDEDDPVRNGVVLPTPKGMKSEKWRSTDMRCHVLYSWRSQDMLNCIDVLEEQLDSTASDVTLLQYLGRISLYLGDCHAASRYFTRCATYVGVYSGYRCAHTAFMAQG